MNFVTTYQLHLIVLCFLIGSIGTLLLFRFPSGHRLWKLADLTWVLLGGLGALTAIVAGLYTDDRSSLNRQIDVAYATSSSFDRDAARFRFRYCDPPENVDIETLCEKVEFLSASTANNAELPLFISLTEAGAQTNSFYLVFGRNRQERDSMEEMADKVETFDVTPFLAFTSLDETTELAIERVAAQRPAVTGDYLILAQSYDALIDQVSALQLEWEYLQANALILVLQVLALCLVSFAAPFRLGKSIAEIRGANPG